MTGHGELADLLLASVTASDIALSIADATRPDVPLIYVNPAFERLTGYPADAAIGRNARFMQGPETDAESVRLIREGLHAGRSTRVRLVNHRADGTPFWLDLHLSPVRDDAGAVSHFVAVQHDVTAEVFAQRTAIEAATRDSLTDLMNRSALAAGLEREIARAERRGTTVAVLFFDLDGFKDVNDTHGHLVGDGYLTHVAGCLRRRLRAHDLAARVGGDEFVAVVTDLPHDGGVALGHVVADLRRSMAEPFTVDGVEHRVSVSVGTAVHPADGRTVRELIAHADTDMYRHKGQRQRRHGGTAGGQPAPGP